MVRKNQVIDQRLLEEAVRLTRAAPRPGEMKLHRSRSTLPSLVLLLAALGAASSGRAAVPEQAAPTVLPATGVEVVRLEVMVSEKRGRPHAGLRREDFAVFEDGQPQAIVQFQAFARPAASAPASPAAAPAAPAANVDEREGEEEQLPARYVVLAIDDVHMEFDSLTRVRKALERFLWEDLRPEDQVALVTTSGASALSQEFTSDRAVLRQTLSRLSAQGRRADWNSAPRLSEYQAEQIENGDPLALEAAAQEVLHEGMIQGAETAEDMSRQKARVVLNEAVANSRLTLEALESVCRGLGGITGRKALFLVSDGFLTGLSARSGTGFDLRRIADAGMRAGVVVYALDTRGLVASSPGLSASSSARVITTTFGTVEAMRQRSLEATRDALHALAADTGGFLAENSNNLRAGLRELLKDTETYYVLAYESANTKRDGAFRRIEVKVQGVSGLKIRTRSGYFAADDRRAGATEGGAEAAARRTAQRQSEMRTALVSLAPLAGIPIRLSADFVVLDSAEGRVVVSASLDVSGLPFVQRENRRQATLEAAGLVYDASGQLVSRLDEERLTVDVGDEDYAQLRRRGLPYRRELALKPGRYQVRVAARDDATGLLGSAWHRVEVPDLSLGRLALSGLFLMKEATAVPPGEPGAAPALRSVQELPRFGRGEKLYVQLQAYNPKRDVTGATALVCQAAVLRGGAVLATAAPEPMVPGDASGPIAHVSRIGLRPFEPGDYELRVTVTDGNASATATRSVAFTVE